MLTVGVDNLPVTGADAFDPTADFMTMKKIGLRQDVPARAKREARRTRRRAIVERSSVTVRSGPYKQYQTSHNVYYVKRTPAVSCRQSPAFGFVTKRRRSRHPLISMANAAPISLRLCLARDDLYPS